MVFGREIGATVFSFIAFGNNATELFCGKLSAIADAEGGEAGCDGFNIDHRSVWLVARGWRARQDDAFDIRIFGYFFVKWDDFAVYIGFANHPCYKLGILRPKIDDDDFFHDCYKGKSKKKRGM